ncbi:MAG: ThiF family adenylyltransferase [Candidatus Nanohaloarchaea archaeon]
MYSRFKTLEKFGEEELRQLQDSRAAVIGLGATGSVIAETLARHGVELVLVDRDYLEPKDVYSSNIYTPEQCENAMPKAKAAGEYLSQFTEVDSRVESFPVPLDADILLDGTDNMEARFAINDYAKKNEVPWVYTAAIGEKGYSAFFHQKCFNCVFDQVAAGLLDTCETAGVMREVAGIVALKSAEKAVRYLAGKEVEEKLEFSSGKKLEIEHPGCEVCRGENYPHLETAPAVKLCGEDKYQLEREVHENAFSRLKEEGDVIAENNYLLRAEVSGKEFTLFRSGRAIVEARDRGEAESFFSSVLGI